LVIVPANLDSKELGQMGQQPGIRLSKTSAAPREVVYDMLADLRSHLRWAGAEQSSDFRLVSMDAPDGPATVGTAFATTGTIPMSASRWNDRSTVTVADRPSTFEFVTDGQVSRGRKSMLARYRHRYELAPAPGGCTVNYTMTQERITDPILRLGLPVVRQMMWSVGIPMFAGRGFRNLLADAEAAMRAGRAVASAGVQQPS
jgi:hypothetical protein